NPDTNGTPPDRRWGSLPIEPTSGRSPRGSGPGTWTGPAAPTRSRARRPTRRTLPGHRPACRSPAHPDMTAGRSGPSWSGPPRTRRSAQVSDTRGQLLIGVLQGLGSLLQVRGHALDTLDGLLGTRGELLVRLLALAEGLVRLEARGHRVVHLRGQVRQLVHDRGLPVTQLTRGAPKLLVGHVHVRHEIPLSFRPAPTADPTNPDTNGTPTDR